MSRHKLIMYFSDCTYAERLVAIPYLVKNVIAWQDRQVLFYEYGNSGIIPVANLAN